MVAAVMVLILVSKSLAALGIVLLLGYPLSTALTVSASLAQIGEFSFILSGLGIRYGLMAPEGLNLILAGALLSITLNPLVFAGAERMIRWIRATPKLNYRFEESANARFARLKEELEHAHRRQAEKVAAGKTLHAGRIGRPVSPVRRSNARAARSAGLALRHAHGGAG
jgi:CPA2 family monovalent cation:H+ antiporter-2